MVLYPVVQLEPTAFSFMVRRRNDARVSRIFPTRRNFELVGFCLYRDFCPVHIFFRYSPKSSVFTFLGFSPGPTSFSLHTSSVVLNSSNGGGGT